MLKRFQSFFMKNDVHNRQPSMYQASGARNPSIESWNVYTKAQLYSQESKQDPERQSIARLPVSNEVRDRKIDQHVQAGIQFHELGQLEKATHHFRLAAKEGCPIGMFLYGISLRHGWGCRLNTTLAFQYLQTAAEHAVDDLLQGDDCALASRGELIIAIYELGVSFQQGWGVPKNKETAFYYFEIAANLGDADSMTDIAFCYTHGHGVKKDIYKAAYYYRMASKQGQDQVGNSWIWKDKYNIVDEPNWDGKPHAISKA